MLQRAASPSIPGVWPSGATSQRQRQGLFQGEQLQRRMRALSVPPQPQDLFTFQRGAAGKRRRSVLGGKVGVQPSVCLLEGWADRLEQWWSDSVTPNNSSSQKEKSKEKKRNTWKIHQIKQSLPVKWENTVVGQRMFKRVRAWMRAREGGLGGFCFLSCLPSLKQHK